MLINHYVIKLIKLEGVKFKDTYVEQDEVKILVVNRNALLVKENLGY